jgi:glycosyltransferase involved in cell wall biosynthesis
MTPRVSVGLPVFNGERYLEEALDSLLGQTYGDFEVVISDNASSDATPQICQVYAKRDSRIRYYRNDANLGGAANFNRVFRMCRGEYFKWMGHDDVCRPEYLERCVTVLGREAAVVLSYPGQIFVDERGGFIERRPYGLNTSLVERDERFRAVIHLSQATPAIFGLMRRAVLAKTQLIGKYAAADKVLLAELALHGRFHEVDGDLHLNRQHPMRSTVVYPTRQLMVRWFDPANTANIVFPNWRLVREYGRAISRAPLGRRERMRCRLHLVGWLRANRRRLAKDLYVAGKELGSCLAESRHSVETRPEGERARSLRRHTGQS